MNATEQMLEEVRRVKKEADKTRSDLSSYINGAERDYFGDKEDFSYYICSCYEDAIAAFRMQSKELDEACRPLLYKKPGPAAVRAVRDLLAQLRENQYVETWCSGGIWGDTARVTIRVSYRPNTESRMAARYWERCYENMPEARELEAEEWLQKEETRRKAREAEEAAVREKEAQIARERRALAPMLEEKKKELQKQLKSADYDRNQVKKRMEKTAEEDERNLQELRIRRESLGFFKFSEKKELAQQIRELEHQNKLRRAELEKKEKEVLLQIGELNQKVQMLSAKAGSKFLFGKQLYDDSKPMQWIVISNDGLEIKLLAEQIVSQNSYKSGMEWQNGELLNRVFTREEEAVLKIQERYPFRYKVLYPLEEEVLAGNSGLPAQPDPALLNFIQEEAWRIGRKLGYTKLMIENRILDHTKDVRRYWLTTKEYYGRGPRPYAGKNEDMDQWQISTSGISAKLGIRPMICLDLEKLLQIL